MEASRSALRLLDRLDKVTGIPGGWMARCPAHQDGRPSLKIAEAANLDGVVINCFAGCDTDSIVKAIGLSPSDLFNTPPTSQRTIPRVKQMPARHVCTYSYTDEDGNLIYEVRRDTNKLFIPWRPVDGRLIKGLPNTVRRPLYRLPDVIKAVEAQTPIYVVEGEKDADRLHDLGHVATCSSNGATQFHRVTDAATVLTGAHVIVIIDNDPQGYKHGRQVVEILTGSAASIVVKRAALDEPKSDVSDHLDAGLTLDQLKPVDLGNDTDEQDGDDEEEDRPFRFTDIDQALRNGTEPVRPDMLKMEDGRSLLHRSRLNGIHGDSGVGKSWIAAYCIKQEMDDTNSVLVVDLEDTEGPLISRLRQIGATNDQIRDHLQFLAPSDVFNPANVSDLITQIAATGVAHVFIDSLGEALAGDGVNANEDTGVAAWIATVSRRIIRETGAGVTHIDHVTKAKENMLFPTGSHRKRAAITGLSWYVSAETPMSITAGGAIKFTCGKDRHGSYKAGDHVAMFNMAAGGGSIELVAADSAVSTWQEKRDDRYRRLIDFIREHPEGVNTRAIHDGVPGKTQAIGDALEGLAARGKIRREDRKNNEKVWHYVTNSECFPVSTPRPGDRETPDDDRDESQHLDFSSVSLDPSVSHPRETLDSDGNPYDVTVSSTDDPSVSLFPDPRQGDRETLDSDTSDPELTSSPTPGADVTSEPAPTPPTATTTFFPDSDPRDIPVTYGPDGVERRRIGKRAEQ